MSHLSQKTKGKTKRNDGTVECEGRPTYLEGPSSAMFVIVADSLELAATREFPGDKLQNSPQEFAVEKQEELGHHSGEEDKKEEERG